jgi:hypothetical protein
MKKIIIVKADCNDGDYLYNIIDNMSSEDFERFTKIADIIKNEGHNWDNSEYGQYTPIVMYEGILTENDIEFFGSFLPYGEYGIHTIDSIRVLDVAEDKELLGEIK